MNSALASQVLDARFCAPKARGRALRLQRGAGVAPRAAAAPESDVKDGVRCYMTAEGVLVCERLEPGNYRLEAAAPKEHTGDGAAPRCDSLNPKDCLTYCYVMDDGSMVCEGLPSGDYQIRKAGDGDLPALVEHAQKLRDGVSTIAADTVAKAEKPVEEAGGFLSGIIAKITGKARST